ncbi:MAG TPA: M48 family metallopeptidase [Pontiella sp.]
MDFFARQDSARKQTGLLSVYFGLAVVLTALLVYFLPVSVWFLHRTKQGAPDISPPGFWHPDLFMTVCGITLAVIAGGTLFKIAQLKHGGGSGVAEMLGGRQILPGSADFFERRLLNVVEEMAIASGVTVPPVYVMETEKGINAFAAGFGISDAVVAVTYGTMTGLTRDELQGVVAHEFSHILNQDMRININLMGFLHGLLIIGLTGRVLLEFGAHMSMGRRNRDAGRLAIPVVAAGLVLLIVGFSGFFFCKLIKASISRQREQLADASAVQFTRNPAGLAGALKKIGGLSFGSRIHAPNAEQASHMFFGKGNKGSIFSTHPPLAERVRWLEPSFSGSFEPVTLEALHEALIGTEGAPQAVESVQPLTDVYGTPVSIPQAPEPYPRAPGKRRARNANSLSSMGSSLVGMTRKAPALAQDAIDSVPEIFDAARRRPQPLSGHSLLESIGKPMLHHEETARTLIASIPEQIKQHARDPYGARMLIHLLLLDQNVKVRSKQMSLLKQMAEPEVFQTLENALPSIEAIRPEQRLPIIDLAIPALRFLAAEQYVSFMQTVKALVEADEKTDVFEYALQRVLAHHLDPVFGRAPKKRAANYYSVRGLIRETSVLLSVLARRCHGLGAEAASAFTAAVEVMNEPKTQFILLNPNDCSWERLDAALNRLNEGSGQIKKQLLSAALACMMHDREISVEEVELFRAIAAGLDCPVPPWVTPIELDTL